MQLSQTSHFLKSTMKTHPPRQKNSALAMRTRRRFDTCKKHTFRQIGVKKLQTDSTVNPNVFISLMFHQDEYGENIFTTDCEMHLLTLCNVHSKTAVKSATCSSSFSLPKTELTSLFNKPL